MRILWLQLYYATPRGWGSQRTQAFARRFVAAGHSVEVLCSAAYDASLAGQAETACEGVRIRVTPTRYWQQMGFWRRLAAFADFLGRSVWFVLCRGRNYDIVIASSGPLSMAIPALLGRWVHGLPFVFEVIDVWPDAAIAAGVLRNRVFQAAAFRLEALAYKNAARIVTCSTGMTERILRKRVPAEKLVTIPNCSDPADFARALLLRDSTRRELGVADGQLVVLYLGAMGRTNAIADVCHAAQATAGDTRIVWWFAGDGADAGQLRKIAEQTGGRFLGCVSPRSRMTEICAAADVGMVSFLHAPLFYENSPNKFFDYIVAGLAVVFNRTTWLEGVMAEYGNGYICAGEQPGAEMAACLQRVAANPGIVAQMRQASRRLAAERFDHGVMAETYLRVLAETNTGYNP